MAVILVSLGALGLVPHVAGELGASAGAPFRSESGGCRVVDVVDGDTLTLACAGRRPERARLTGFDTPELFSPGCVGEAVHALRAKHHLGRLVRGADHIGVVRQGRDRYGRALVALSVDGRPVAGQMISAGLARPYDGGRRGGWCGVDEVRTAERGTTAKWVQLDG